MTAAIVGTPQLSDNGAGDVVATMPGSIVLGELIFTHIAYDQGAQMTTPAGFTEANQGHTDGEAGVYVGHRTSDGADDASYTFISDDSDGWLAYAFRVEDHGGIDVISTVSAGNDGTPIAPSVITTVDNCLVINFVSMDLNGSSPFTSPDTELYDQGNRGVGIAASYFTQLTAGATGTRSFTAGTSAHWRTMTVAIAPEASGAPIPAIVNHLKQQGIL